MTRILHLSSNEYNGILKRYIQALNVGGKGHEAKRAKYYIFQYYQKGLNRTYREVDGYEMVARSLIDDVKFPDISFQSCPVPNLRVTPTVYQWSEGDVFVNFAARHLGGGVLNTGWVQEEFLTSCLDLLPFISNLSREYSNLHQDPAIFKTNAIFEPNLKFYGRQTGLIKHYRSIEKDPSQVLHLLKKPIPIYWLSMAAINLKGSPTSKDIQSMLYVAIRAFYLTLLTLFEASSHNYTINTGNWGAGAFGWDARASFCIQWFAFGLARQIFQTDHPQIDLNSIVFHYHTYDKAIYDQIQSISSKSLNDLTITSFPNELMSKL